MKIAEILARVDDEKLNQYDARVKTAWLSEVEGMVVDEILNMAEGNDIEFDGYDYDRDFEKTLLVPDRFGDVYSNYLAAKIDYKNGEIERYNNSVAAFESSFQAFAAYYRRKQRCTRGTNKIKKKR